MEMDWNDEEFYGEPSEFDMQIDDFKKALLSSVKTEFIDKMTRLEKENFELQDVKNNLKQIKADYDNKARELEVKKQNAKHEAKKMRLSELMKDYQIFLYAASVKWKQEEKCNHCNEQRLIEFSMPSGRKTYVQCECNTSSRYYVVSQHAIYTLQLNSDGKVYAYYKLIDDGKYGEYLKFSNEFDSHIVENIITEYTKYVDVDIHKPYFTTQEECQKYCDWLNANQN